MIKILHPILCYYPSQQGGPANTLYWLNSTLNEKQYKKTVISTSYGIENFNSHKKFDVNHNAYYHKSINYNFLKQSFFEICKNDIIQFSSIFFPPTIFLILFSIFKEKTIIISPRGELFRPALSQKYYKKKIMLFFLKFFQKKINFHATNKFELSLINETFNKSKSCVLIPNLIKLPEQYNSKINDTFLFIGRINPIKNIHLLILAFYKIHKIHRNYELNIVGSAKSRNEMDYFLNLKKQVSDLGLEENIIFKGHLIGEKKNKLIANSKFLILPSKSENFGNVVLESLIQGTPVIATKNTPWQILEKFNAGFWINANVDDLFNTMLLVVGMNNDKYYQMRKNAISLCKNNFDIDLKISLWNDYYNELCESK